jgi:hypothetical protein
MKNKTSSIGRLKILIPRMYSGLKLQTPLAVNCISHKIKKTPVINIAGNKYFQDL